MTGTLGMLDQRLAHRLAPRRAPAGSLRAAARPRAGSRPAAWTVCGTSSDGLMITAFPQSSAGNIFQVGNRQREVERRDEPGDADRAGGSSSPTCCAAPTARCGRRAGAPRWPRSRRCRSPPARRRASRRAPCPSRASSRRRSPPSARPAGRRPGASTSPRAGAGVRDQQREAARGGPHRRVDVAARRSRGSGRSGRACRPGCGSRSRLPVAGATHSPAMKLRKVLAIGPESGGERAIWCRATGWAPRCAPATAARSRLGRRWSRVPSSRERCGLPPDRASVAGQVRLALA